VNIDVADGHAVETAVDSVLHVSSFPEGTRAALARPKVTLPNASGRSSTA
jgi:hypothetical protein